MRQGRDANVDLVGKRRAGVETHQGFFSATPNFGFEFGSPVHGANPHETTSPKILKPKHLITATDVGRRGAISALMAVLLSARIVEHCPWRYREIVRVSSDASKQGCCLVIPSLREVSYS